MPCFFITSIRMKRKVKYLKYILPVITALVMVLVFAVPVFAIDSPDEIAINHVWVYSNLIEEDDQMYIVDFTIDYTVNPTETAAEAFLLVMLDGADVLDVKVPYPYEDDGYVRGVIGFYFSASDAWTWHGAYTMQIRGNPDLAWSAAVPIVSVAAFDLWQDADSPISKQLLSDRILWLGNQFDLEWGAAYTLLETLAQGQFLTTEGIEYFANTIPNLATVAPYCLANRTVPPELIDREFTQDYSDDLVTGITGTAFDLTDLGTAFGMSRGAMTAALYYICVFIFIIILARRLETTKPAVLIAFPAVILGAFLGVPLVATIIVAFACLLLIAYVFFYRPANI